MGLTLTPYKEEKCPECGTDLEYFDGLEIAPDYFYCPVCLDWAYDDTGERLFQLV